MAFVATNNAKASGDIWDDADPVFNNYTYHYTIQHRHIAIKGKLLLDKGSFFAPWLSASLGAGFNRAYRYANKPTIYQALPNANFASHKTTAFTYTLGAGVQHILTKHLTAGIGYEFSDWGKSQLHRAAGQTIGNGLALNHLYTNGVLLNLTYIA